MRPEDPEDLVAGRSSWPGQWMSLEFCCFFLPYPTQLGIPSFAGLQDLPWGIWMDLVDYV